MRNKKGFFTGAVIGVIAGFSTACLVLLMDQASGNTSIKDLSKFQGDYIKTLI